MKISLSRMDSLIHEDEDLLKLNEEEGEKDYHDNSLTITEIQNTDPIAKLLMQFRIHIHSMLRQAIQRMFRDIPDPFSQILKNA